jgi:hypothetical protein
MQIIDQSGTNFSHWGKKFAPSIILKFITTFDLRTTTFRAKFSKKKFHNFGICLQYFVGPF